LTAKSGVKTALERENRENRARLAKIAADNSVASLLVPLAIFKRSTRRDFLTIFSLRAVRKRFL